MTQQEKEIMFLYLNDILVKFWIEQGRPDKEVRIELLERMLNWYKKMGYVTLDKQSKEPVSEDLEAKAAQYESYFDVGEQHGYLCVNKGEMAEAFKDGARWQKEQMGEQARKELAKTDITLADLVAFDEGFKLGRSLERQDMLKDAVEGYIAQRINGELYAKCHIPKAMDLEFGDKVKIVIVPIKED